MRPIRGRVRLRGISEACGNLVWRKCRDRRPLFIWQTFPPRTLRRFGELRLSLIPLSGLSTVRELRDRGGHGPTLPELTAQAGKQIAQRRRSR